MQARAKSRAKSADTVEAGNITLNNNTSRQYWNQASANEVRNQLKLRNVPLDLWRFKPREDLVSILIKAIKASKK